MRIFQCFSCYNAREFRQTSVDWDWWGVCHRFINLTDWRERRVTCQQLLVISDKWKGFIFSRALFRTGNSCKTPQFRVSYRAQDDNSLFQSTHKWAIDLNTRKEIPSVQTLMYFLSSSHDMCLNGRNRKTRTVIINEETQITRVMILTFFFSFWSPVLDVALQLWLD